MLKLKLTKKSLVSGVVITAVLAAYLVLVVSFYKSTPFYHLYSSQPGAYVNYEKAAVLGIQSESLARLSNGLYLGTQDVKIRILTGEHKGQIMTVKNYLNYTTNVRATTGSDVIVIIDTADKNTYDVWIYSYDRGPFLLIFALVFIAVLCAIGGSRGIKSVLGIIFTFTSIVFLFIPLLYRGYSPAVAAMGVVIVTLCVSLVLLGGFSAKTLSAILGAAAGVAISDLILAVALTLTHLSGYSTNESDTLIQIAGATHMQIGQLLFAAILISSLGAIMDIAISIASSVNEVYAGNNSLNVKELFNSGMNVGRDMMGTMANTLIIAFTGAALNTLVLLYAWNVSYYQLINSSLVGIYVIQAVSGSIAVILTVPLVAFVSARLIPALAAGANKMDGEG